MKNLKLAAVSASLFLSFSTAAISAPPSKADYQAGKATISTTYKSDKAACQPMNGNAKDVCVEEAKGREKIARAELEASYEPSTKHSYDVRLAKADAAYAVAKEKCDDAAGNARDVCRKEAKAAYVSAKADAKVTEKTADAKADAREKTHDANMTAHEKTTGARKDAAMEKRDAGYAVAKEKCDALAGDSKTACVNEAKVRYAQ